MNTKDHVTNFISGFGFIPHKTKAEIQELPSLLHPGEILLALLEGQLKRLHHNEITGYGLLIATDTRIIFFRKSLLGMVTKEEALLTNVVSVSLHDGLFSDSIVFTIADNESVIEHCDKIAAKKFTDVVQCLVPGQASLIAKLVPVTNS